MKVGRVVLGPGKIHPEVLNYDRVKIAPRTVQAMTPRLAAGLWPLIQALERACWSRKWSAVKKARKALEAHIGKRPHDPLFVVDGDGAADGR
jgi:hypothetical protein